MNSKSLGLLREFLAAASVALLVYGIGTDVLWQTVTGGVVAVWMLVAGLRANEGWETLGSVIRKVLSAVGGVLVLQGALSPERADALIGVIINLLAMAWSAKAKTGSGDTERKV